MEVTVCQIVFNEGEFLKASLESVYAWAKKIVIVEGCVKLYAQLWNNIDGRSIDNTLEIIKNFPDSEKKIKLITKTGCWNNKKEMRNAYLQEVSTPWMLVLDADEIYTKKDLETITDITEKHKDLGCLLYPHIHFWKMFNFYVTGGSWDKTQLRFSRFEKGYRYDVHYTLSDKDGKILQSDPKYKKERFYAKNHINTQYSEERLKGMGNILEDNIWIYHYAHCKNDFFVRDKLLYYQKRDNAPSKQSSVWDIRWKDLEFLKNNKDIKRFEGTHPEPIQKLLS